jgi:hypothetical protein
LVASVGNPYWGYIFGDSEIYIRQLIVYSPCLRNASSTLIAHVSIQSLFFALGGVNNKAPLHETPGVSVSMLVGGFLPDVVQCVVLLGEAPGTSIHGFVYVTTPTS